MTMPEKLQIIAHNFNSTELGWNLQKYYEGC